MRDDELASVIDEVRNRIRARYPDQALDKNQDQPADSALPHLMNLLYARDAAEAKVAAIGSVNPRLPGIGNSLIQWVKRKIARGLDWHVREQVAFNRAALDCVQAALEALTDVSRMLAALEQNGTQSREQREKFDMLVLRTIAEMEASLQDRTAELERSFKQFSSAQHAAFEKSLEKSAEATRREIEQLIHAELRLIRQRAVLRLEHVPCGANRELGAQETDAFPAHCCGPSSSIDWLRFADLFRGPEEQIRERHRRHVTKFADCSEVLDIGCGRGEFLEVARDAGIPALGVDRSPECVALCRSKGLAAELSDVVLYLDAAEDRSLAGVFCAHVVEHLEPLRVPNLIALIGRKLKPEGVIVIETPNPDDAETMARHFWIDPTHTRPVPVALLRFYLEEAGFGGIEVGMGADYWIAGRRLGSSLCAAASGPHPQVSASKIWTPQDETAGRR